MHVTLQLDTSNPSDVATLAKIFGGEEPKPAKNTKSAKTVEPVAGNPDSATAPAVTAATTTEPAAGVKLREDAPAEVVKLLTKTDKPTLGDAVLKMAATRRPEVLDILRSFKPDAKPDEVVKIGHLKPELYPKIAAAIVAAYQE